MFVSYNPLKGQTYQFTIEVVKVPYLVKNLWISFFISLKLLDFYLKKRPFVGINCDYLSLKCTRNHFPITSCEDEYEKKDFSNTE